MVLIGSEYPIKFVYNGKIHRKKEQFNDWIHLIKLEFLLFDCIHNKFVVASAIIINIIIIWHELNYSLIIGLNGPEHAEAH